MTDALDRYLARPDADDPGRWEGHYFEIAEITEVLLARAEGEDHAV